MREWVGREIERPALDVVSFTSHDKVDASYDCLLHGSANIHDSTNMTSEEQAEGSFDRD